MTREKLKGFKTQSSEQGGNEMGITVWPPQV